MESRGDEAKKWSFRAISAQNGDWVFPQNGELFQFFLLRLEEEGFSFQMVCFLILNYKLQYLFDLVENGRFSRPTFIKRV